MDIELHLNYLFIHVLQRYIIKNACSVTQVIAVSTTNR